MIFKHFNKKFVDIYTFAFIEWKKQKAGVQVPAVCVQRTDYETQ